MDIEVNLARRSALHRALSEPHRLAILDAVRLTDRTPGELAALVELPLNLVAFHVSVLQEAGLVERRRSGGDGRRRYVRALPEAIEQLIAGLAATRGTELAAERVLFVCSHNAARSQLAEALWRGRTGRVARSAGSEPARQVHPLAVAIAGSRGVDLSRAVPRGFEDVVEKPDLVVTVCDRALEGGVPFPDAAHLHWSIDDPILDGSPAAFARAYDDVAERVELLAEAVAA